MGASNATPVESWCDKQENKNPNESNYYKSKIQYDGSKETIVDLWEKSVSKFPDTPCIGTRLKLEDGKLGVYEFKSYKEVDKLASNLGSSIRRLNLCPKISEKGEKMSYMGVYSSNREEWAILILGCAKINVTLVPIYDTLGPDTLEFVLKHTNLTSLACSGNHIKNLLELKSKGNSGNLANIISFDNEVGEEVEKAEKLGITILSNKTLCEVKNNDTIDGEQPTLDATYMLMYTSGTTGDPKGAKISHYNITSALGSVNTVVPLNENDVHLSYLPLAHIFEQMNLLNALNNGARVGMFSGDILKLKEDMQELKPTIFPSVPRLYNKFYGLIKSQFDAATGIKKKLIDRAIETKLHNLRTQSSYTHMLYDTLIFNKVRAIFGGRVRFMITGAAPIDKTVLEFLKIVFCCPIIEGYGQTENTAVATMTSIHDPESGHVGSINPGLMLKLVDVPEMNYTHTDLDENGNNVPRGEVCVYGPNVFQGYFKDPEKTREALDDDGWLHSGDIGMVTTKGQLKIIDRKKNIFKLQQGEYVAPEKIENVYIKSNFISQCWVYGDSYKTYLVAIIVPEEIYLVNYAEKELNLKDSFADLCLKPEINQLFMKELKKVGTEGKLRGFEHVKFIYLDSTLFSIENNLLTPTFKLKRNECKINYQDILNKLYGS